MVSFLFVVLLTYPTGVIRCQKCHSQVWRDWRGSLHALASDDPVFQGSLREIEEKESGFCFKCHDPFGKGEGIPCTFCHSVSGYSQDNVPPLELTESDTIFGPYALGDKTPHPVKELPLFKESRFCGSCHDVVNRKGFLLFSTYTEWKNSSYRIEGITCQMCHMPEDQLRSPVDMPYETDMILTAHGFKGGHSAYHVRKALSLVLFPVKRKEPLEVRVDLTNREAGHSLPTGIPTRKVRLQVDLLDDKDNLIDRAEKVYERIVGDSAGKRLTTFQDMFFLALMNLRDNRLMPRKTVHEKFFFPSADPAKVARVQARAYYEMGNLPIPKGAEAKILLASQEVEIGRKHLSPYFYWFLSLTLLFLVLFVIGYLLVRNRT